MSTIAQVNQLRATANHLRSLAGRIGESRALTAYGLADTDTWVGTTQQVSYSELVAVRRSLQANQQELTDTANHLERQAEVLEQQAPILKAVPS
ncbi:MAG: hypothetical protein ABIZ69_15410 [Ilumatobacteraceae bacterium]